MRNAVNSTGRGSVVLRVAPHESSQKLTIRGTAPPEFPAASPMLLPAGGTCEDRLRTHTNIFVVPLDPGSAAYERWAVKPKGNYRT